MGPRDVSLAPIMSASRAGSDVTGTAPTERDAVAFILRLGRALHSFGYAAHGLEEVLGLVAERLGLRAQFFSTPTSIFAGFGSEDAQRTYMLRVEPGEVDLGKLSSLDRVTRRVLRGEIIPGEGSRQVEQIVSAPPRYGPVLTTGAMALTSGAAARFLGGGAAEMAVATGVGLLIGVLAAGVGRRPAAARIMEPLAALLASVLATGIAQLGVPLSVYLATLAGLIVLVPGLQLTVAMTELSTRNLASGTARLAGAFVVFLGLAFGVAVGNTLARSVFGVPISIEPVALPVWTEWIALMVAPVGFAILFRAEVDDVLPIMAVGVLAFVGVRLGARALGPQLGVFIGALTAGVASNLYARWRGRPAAVTLVPGVLLLVPGSVGFRSLASLLDRQVLLGVETAFTMILMAVALVAGLLFANIVAPEERPV